MLTIKDSVIRKNEYLNVVGYDIGRSFAQISRFSSKDEEPSTISAIAGYEQYNIPVVLAKKRGTGQWFYGREAVKASEDEDCIRIDDLIHKAERGEEVLVDDEGYDPVALLTLFVKKSLALLETELSLKDINAFIFTVEELTPRLVEVLGRTAAALSLKCDMMTYQSHTESFYYYMLHQDASLRDRGATILELNESLKLYKLKINERTEPKVCLIGRSDYPDFIYDIKDDYENLKASGERRLDERLMKILEKELSEQSFGSVYLLGQGFKEDWMKESLKVLLRGRRAFKGNNLYSKGACYSLMDKLSPSAIDREYVFLGEDKLKSNIGLRVMKRGKEAYFALIDAGSNWYEAQRDIQIILAEGNSISFVITSLTGGQVINKTIELDGLPERPKRTTRLSFHLEMNDVNTLEIDIEDMGFGEIEKSSGLAWSHTIELY